MGISVETIQTERFTMDYFRFGKGSETLVILPGLSVQSVMGAADAVAEAYKLLADDFTIYMPDRRKELPPAYSVQEMARDTAEALRALGLEQVDLFGASQGGMMALRITLDHPELVKKLVLGSSAACVTEERYRIIEDWIRLAKQERAEELYLAFGEALYPRALFEQSRELLAGLAKTVTAEELKRFVILAEGMKGFDLTARLEEIACPVLVIGDMDDRVLGAEASKQIAASLQKHAGVELFMYDHYGHAAYDTAPDYKERLLKFLTQK